MEKQMYWDDLREIVERHFAPQLSKYLYGGRKTGFEWEYYYNTDCFESAKDIFEKIENGELTMASGIDHISFQLFSSDLGFKAQCPCILRLKETDSFFQLVFYAATGYEVVRSYGGKPAIRLTQMEDPSLKLAFSKKYGSILQENKNAKLISFRISWWINRLLKQNDDFRLFLIDLLERKGEIAYIYKDIARSVRKDHYCLISDSFQEVERYYNPDSLIRGITQTKVKVDFNKRDLNHAYYIAKFAKHVEERDLGIILTMDFDYVSEWLSGHDIKPTHLIGYFTMSYYQKKFGCTREVQSLVLDYMHLCRNNGIKISLRFSTIERMREIVEGEHRRIAQSEDDGIPEELVPCDSRFRSLEKNLPDDYEWIKTKTRLFDEGNKQHNCVYSYRARIRQDMLAIVHWEFQGRTYTIEVRVGAGGFFDVVQMKGKYNIDPPAEDYQKAAECIHAIRATRLLEKCG